jgi:hypothetical protein
MPPAILDAGLMEDRSPAAAVNMQLNQALQKQVR